MCSMIESWISVGIQTFSLIVYALEVFGCIDGGFQEASSPQGLWWRVKKVTPPRGPPSPCRRGKTPPVTFTVRTG